MWAIDSIPSVMRNNVQLLFGKPTCGTEATVAHRHTGEATARFLSMVSSQGTPKA